MDALVLFDIDATLLLTGGAGLSAMQAAGHQIHGERFSVQGIDFAGRLDPLIYIEIMQRGGIPRTPGDERRFRTVYAGQLQQTLSRPGPARALPGAADLVSAVRSWGGAATGVLTGNYRETGQMKLRACGLDPDWFVVSAWGDDSPHDPPDREHLPPVAMARHRERFGGELDPARVTIIGDTPHDVRCAKASGCRVIGVGTGRFSASELRACGADHAVDDLTATGAIMSWLKQ